MKIHVFILRCCFVIQCVVLANCGGGSSTQSGTTDGAALYADNCQTCHGPLASSSKRGATVAMIQNAIANNFGGMGKFSTLTTAQIQAISVALQ